MKKSIVPFGIKPVCLKIFLIGTLFAVLQFFNSASFGQIAGVIGIKLAFTGGWATSDDLAPTDQAGVVAVTNWNNLQASIPAGANNAQREAGMCIAWSVAQDSAGNPLSGVTVIPAGFNDGWYSGGTECADGRLLYDCWKFGNNSGDGALQDAAGHYYATLTIARLPASAYDVYVYLNNDNDNYWGNLQANSIIAVGTNVDSDGFNGADSDPCNSNPQLQTASGYNGGNPANDANYVKLPGVATGAGDMITITAVDQGGDFGVSGIELVPLANLPVPGPPVESPANASAGISAGTNVTLYANATGSTPISYQWQTDGGSGEILTNIPGATGSNLLVSTAGLVAGIYKYDFVASNSVGVGTSSAALITVATVMADLGPNAPSPGPVDISQIVNTAQNDDGFDYYTDNGPAYGHWCGQTFITGTNQDGYVLHNLAWKSAGNGNSFGSGQLYDLYFYLISPDGTQATEIASYKGYGGGTENDWFQWQGLSVPLAPSQVYGYAFGRDPSAGGWEHIGDQGGNPYPGGQLMTVANTAGTGPVTYGATGGSDATFDLGMTVYQNPAPYAVSPAIISNLPPIYAGMPVTLREAALGLPPFSYQWLTDNGTGGALVTIDGANGATLMLNTSSEAPGSYNYAVVVSNAYGSSISAPVTVSILQGSAPALTTDISPAPANEGNVGTTLTFSAAFTGVPAPSYQWSVDVGSGPTPISPSSNPTAVSNTLVLTDLQLTNAGVYSVTARNVQGTASSSDSTLIVVPAAGTPPPSVTVPPVTLVITTNVPGSMSLTWSQGTLLQSTNVNGPWNAIGLSLQTTNYLIAETNSTMFYRSAVSSQPRIVNLYCFCRDQDFRVANSQQVLFNATTQEVLLVRQANLPATFALQYDALMDTNYQNYFKQLAGANIEIGAWWEIPQELVQAAGLTWRGSEEWDPTADVDFSCGYTPAQRLALVDAYMAGFKSVFGYYPKTVGSWYIDEVTLAYMSQKYGIVASCNCKDQLGTDTYTMWGGYWNQAYYPSSLNAYMPAQTAAGQINVPVFRMLGSDPIYQYGNFSPGIYTLEPVYSNAGGSPDWVPWFMNNLIVQPSLAFGYTQAGQENDIDNSWSSIGPGLTDQVALFAAQAKAGEIQIETLAQTGQWFRNNYSVTPATSVVALDDWQNQGHKAVWYDSRFYRLNLLWTNGAFFIRDLHCFDENMASSTYSNALSTTYFNYETLPMMDGANWSGSGNNSVGMWPVLLSSGGFLIPQGTPTVKEQNPTGLTIQQPLLGGGSFSIICSETNVTCLGVDGQGQPLNWAWLLVGGAPQTSAVQNITSNSISYLFHPVAADGTSGPGVNYQLQINPGDGTCQQLSDGNFRLTPNSAGKLVLVLP